MFHSECYKYHLLVLKYLSEIVMIRGLKCAYK